MTARVGDEIMIAPPERTEPVQAGRVREVRRGRGGVVYLVQWSATGYESLLPDGPDVVITHRHPRGDAALTAGNTRWRSRLRHLLGWGHDRDLARRHQVESERLARRVEEIIAGLGLSQEDWSIAVGRVFHSPQVVSVDPGPPVSVDIRILAGQSPEDFSVHAAAIAYDLGMAEVRVVPLGPSMIRLELLPHERRGGPARR